MGKVYKFDDPAYYDAMTPRLLGWLQASVRETRPGWETGVIVMGEDPLDAAAPAAVLLYMPPGATLRRHAHDCHRVEVVIRGSLDVGDGQMLNPGDVSTAAPGEFYGPHTAGPEGCLSVEIFSAAAGLSPYAPPGISGADAQFEEKRREVIARAKAALGIT
jgi:hypothetical protein